MIPPSLANARSECWIVPAIRIRRRRSRYRTPRSIVTLRAALTLRVCDERATAIVEDSQRVHSAQRSERRLGKYGSDSRCPRSGRQSTRFRHSPSDRGSSPSRDCQPRHSSRAQARGRPTGRCDRKRQSDPRLPAIGYARRRRNDWGLIRVIQQTPNPFDGAVHVLADETVAKLTSIRFLGIGDVYFREPGPKAVYSLIGYSRGPLLRPAERVISPTAAGFSRLAHATRCRPGRPRHARRRISTAAGPPARCAVV